MEGNGFLGFDNISFKMAFTSKIPEYVDGFQGHSYFCHIRVIQYYYVNRMIDNIQGGRKIR